MTDGAPDAAPGVTTGDAHVSPNEEGIVIYTKCRGGKVIFLGAGFRYTSRFEYMVVQIVKVKIEELQNRPPRSEVYMSMVL